MPTLQTYLQLWLALQQTHARVESTLSEAVQATTDLPLVWVEVLHHLNAVPNGELRLQELAEAVTLSQSGLTRLLDRMAEAEFIERRPCQRDRRGAYALITPTGQTALQHVMPAVDTALQQQFSALTEEQVTELQQLLAQL